MWRRAARMPAFESASTFSPRKRTSPDVGSTSRRMQRPVVLLPHPDSPTRPNISPSSIEKLMSSTAFTIVVAPKSPGFRTKCFTRWPTSSNAPIRLAGLRLRPASVWPGLAGDRVHLVGVVRPSRPGRRAAGNGREQALRVVVRRRAQDLADRPLLHDAAPVHHRDAVRHLRNHTE